MTRVLESTDLTLQVVSHHISERPIDLDSIYKMLSGSLTARVVNPPITS